MPLRCFVPNPLHDKESEQFVARYIERAPLSLEKLFIQDNQDNSVAYYTFLEKATLILSHNAPYPSTIATITMVRVTTPFCQHTDERGLPARHRARGAKSPQNRLIGISDGRRWSCVG